MRRFFFGYSLVESLVTLFIVAMVLTMSIANYRSAQNSLLLQQTALNLSSALRDAQQHALAGTTTDADANYGYGMHFYKFSSQYILFADQKTSTGGIPGDSYYNDNVQDFLFPSQPEDRPSRIDLKISVIGTGACVTTEDVSTVDVVFKPPLPETSIKVNAEDANSCDIACLDLSLGAGSKKTRVKITKLSGLIDIIDNVTGGCS